MTDYPTGSPAAGWYTDPADASLQRWWGGSQWTHDTRPVPAPAFAAPAIAAPAAVGVPGGGINPFAAMDAQQLTPQATRPSEAPTFSRGANDFSDFNTFGTSEFAAGSAPAFGASTNAFDATATWGDSTRRAEPSGSPTNGQATAGLLLSLFGFSLFGIILSVIGLRRARESEYDGDLPVGRTRSRWGLGLGIAGIVASAAVLALWLFASAWALEQLGGSTPGTSVIEDETITPFDSADATYDRAAYEQEIADEYAWEEMGTPISITCPDVGSTAPGNSITCTIVLSDRTDTWYAEYAEGGSYMYSISSDN